MAYRAAVYGCSSSDDETPSYHCSTAETSTFEMTPCASTTSVLTGDDPLKDHLMSLGKEGFCCCVSTEDLISDKLDQRLIGWERRSAEHARHSVLLQISEPSLVGAVESSHQYKPAMGGSEKSKLTCMSRVVPAALDSESKLQLRKYIHSSAQPDIPYFFRHHDVSDGNTSQYIEDYKCSYTYPNLQEKNKKLSVIGSSMGTSATGTAIKPTLFVLGGDFLFNHLYNKDDSSSSGLRTRSDPFIGAAVCDLPPFRRRTAPLLGGSGHSSKMAMVDHGISASPLHGHGHHKHRELGVPRCYASSREAIEISGKLRASRAKNALRTNNSLVKDDGKNIDVAMYVHTDPSHRSRTSPPATSFVIPPPNAKTAAERHRFVVKPSLFNSSTILGTKAVQQCQAVGARPAGNNKRTAPNHTAKRTTNSKQWKSTSNSV